MKRELQRLTETDLSFDRIPNISHLARLLPETQLAMRAVLNGARAMKAVREVGVTDKGGVQNYVTAWDLAAEQVIIKSIEGRYPGDAILSEETRSELPNPLTNKRLWVIDPIDGSANAAHDRSVSVISVGFLQDGQPFSGAVFNPVRNELVYGEVGVGTFVDGEQITVSGQIDLAPATVVTDLGFLVETTHRHMDLAKLSGAASVHMIGSAIASMVDVAAGRYDLFFYTDIKPWDNAAAFALIKAAGGVYRGMDGRQIDIMAKDIVVGNETMVNKFVDAVRSK